MSIDDFMEGVHILQNTYNQKFSKDKLKLFYENLKDMNKDRYITNINQFIKKSQFMPNIAQLRGENTQRVELNFEQRDYSNFDFSKLYANKF